MIMKIKLLSLIALFAVSNSVSAQYYDSKNWKTEYHELGGGWGTVWAEYNPSVFKVDVSGADNQSATGISLGYSQAFPLITDGFLFLEAGLGAQYTFYSDDENQTIDGYKVKVEEDFSMWSLKLPVNLLYKFEIGNSGFSLSPFAGLTLRYNISAQIKAKASADGESYSEKYNLFKKSDMGGSDNTWNRFQVGWQAGLKAIISKSFMISASYGTDFTEIAEKTKLQTATVSLGYCF